MLNPSLKSRFVSEFSGFSRIKKSWPPENKKRPKNKKIKNAIFIEKIKHVKNVFTSMPIVSATQQVGKQKKGEINQSVIYNLLQSHDALGQ